MSIPPAIQTEKLQVGYGAKRIIDDVSVAFPSHEITCIVGGSGSGKTTLFRTIIGLIPPLGGRLWMLGEDLAIAGEAATDSVLRRVGMLFQYGALLNSMTVRENVSFPLREHSDLPAEVIDVLVRIRLEQLGVLHAIDLYPNELSGGMKKRVGLARAMIHDPSVLMCDEPSAGLDPVTSASLDELILQVKETFGLTIIVVTHELDSIRRIADNVVMVGKGLVHFTGTAAAFFDSQDPEIRAYLERRAV